MPGQKEKAEKEEAEKKEGEGQISAIFSGVDADFACWFLGVVFLLLS